MHKIVDRKRRRRLIARLQLTHVVTDAGEALQAAFSVKQVLHRGRFHAFLHDEIKYYAGIDVPWSGAHRQPVQSGKSHRAVDAAARRQGAHGSAAAEMSNNDPAVRDIRRDAPHSAGDIFVREAVKAVAADPFRIKALRYGEVIRTRAVSPVKSSIETRDLRKVREPSSN